MLYPTELRAQKGDPGSEFVHSSHGVRQGFLSSFQVFRAKWKESTAHDIWVHILKRNRDKGMPDRLEIEVQETYFWWSIDEREIFNLWKRVEGITQDKTGLRDRTQDSAWLSEGGGQKEHASHKDDNRKEKVCRQNSIDQTEESRSSNEDVPLM